MATSSVAAAPAPVGDVANGDGHPMIAIGLALVWIVVVVRLSYIWRDYLRRRRGEPAQRWNYARGYADALMRRRQAGGHLRSVD